MTEILFSQLEYHPGQQKVIDEIRRFNVLCCGRRFGKSIFGLDLLIDVALESYPTAWFSPTYKMLAEVWREAVKTLKPITRSKNSTEHRIELITGGSFVFWSMENYDSARGNKYKRIVIDEAAMVADLQEAWQAVIRPTLTDLKGDAFFLSTPKGYNFFKTSFDKGQDPLELEWASWQMPTSTNPYIDPTEIEAARQELPEDVFRQEYLAEFLQGEGSVFRRIRETATLKKREPYQGRFVMGLDWAREADYTVITVLDADTREMVDIDRFNKIGWSVQRDRVKVMADKWKPVVIVAENNSIGSPNIEALQLEGLPVQPFDTTATSKPQIIQSLALAFEKSEIAIINDPVLVAELEAYEQKISHVTGRVSYSAPEGMHDDFVMSLALAWYAVSNRSVVSIMGHYKERAEAIKAGGISDVLNRARKANI